ncbi:MAG: hypothetical protein ABI478_11415 [Propionivibrio sp.]
MPNLDEVARMLGGTVDIQRVPIPCDCTDGFVEAFYGRPEALLDDEVRAAQSAWAFIGKAEEMRFVEALRADLASGRWDAKYGHWRRLAEYADPLRLVIAP